MENWNFAHENFRRDQPDLLCLIHRRKESNQVVGLSWFQKKVSSWTERLSAHGRLTVTTAQHPSKGRRLCFCLSVLMTLLSARYGPHDSRIPSSYDPFEMIQRFCYDVNVGGVVEQNSFGRTWYFCLFVLQGEESVGPI